MCLCIKSKNFAPVPGSCYVSRAAGANSEHPRCATERVEAVTSLDILYSRFHEITTSHMQASDLSKSCGQKYSCPDGEPDCETRSVREQSLFTRGWGSLSVTLLGGSHCWVIILGGLTERHCQLGSSHYLHMAGIVISDSFLSSTHLEMFMV